MTQYISLSSEQALIWGGTIILTSLACRFQKDLFLNPKTNIRGIVLATTINGLALTLAHNAWRDSFKPHDQDQEDLENFRQQYETTKKERMRANIEHQQAKARYDGLNQEVMSKIKQLAEEIAQKDPEKRAVIIERDRLEEQRTALEDQERKEISNKTRLEHEREDLHRLHLAAKARQSAQQGRLDVAESDLANISQNLLECDKDFAILKRKIWVDQQSLQKTEEEKERFLASLFTDLEKKRQLAKRKKTEKERALTLLRQEEADQLERQRYLERQLCDVQEAIRKNQAQLKETQIFFVELRTIESLQKSYSLLDDRKQEAEKLSQENQETLKRLEEEIPRLKQEIKDSQAIIKKDETTLGEIPALFVSPEVPEDIHQRLIFLKLVKERSATKYADQQRKNKIPSKFTCWEAWERSFRETLISGKFDRTFYNGIIISTKKKKVTGVEKFVPKKPIYQNSEGQAIQLRDEDVLHLWVYRMCISEQLVLFYETQVSHLEKKNEKERTLREMQSKLPILKQEKKELKEQIASLALFPIDVLKSLQNHLKEEKGFVSELEQLTIHSKTSLIQQEETELRLLEKNYAEEDETFSKCKQALKERRAAIEEMRKDLKAKEEEQQAKFKLQQYWSSERTAHSRRKEEAAVSLQMLSEEVDDLQIKIESKAQQLSLVEGKIRKIAEKKSQIIIAFNEKDSKRAAIETEIADKNLQLTELRQQLGGDFRQDREKMEAAAQQWKEKKREYLKAFQQYTQKAFQIRRNALQCQKITLLEDETNVLKKEIESLRNHRLEREYISNPFDVREAQKSYLVKKIDYLKEKYLFAIREREYCRYFLDRGVLDADREVIRDAEEKERFCQLKMEIGNKKLFLHERCIEWKEESNKEGFKKFLDDFYHQQALLQSQLMDGSLRDAQKKNVLRYLLILMEKCTFDRSTTVFQEIKTFNIKKFGEDAELPDCFRKLNQEAKDAEATIEGDLANIDDAYEWFCRDLFQEATMRGLFKTNLDFLKIIHKQKLKHQELQDLQKFQDLQREEYQAIQRQCLQELQDLQREEYQAKLKVKTPYHEIKDRKLNQLSQLKQENGNENKTSLQQTFFFFLPEILLLIAYRVGLLGFLFEKVLGAQISWSSARKTCIWTYAVHNATSYLLERDPNV